MTFVSIFRKIHQKKAGKHMIEINGLHKTFPMDATTVEALTDINLQVAAGDIFGVIGQSGAGKSTLLRCIALLEQPTSGTIRLDGQDTAHLAGKELIELRRRMGVIFQGYNLLMQRTVAQNIAFPLELCHWEKSAIAQRVDFLLDLVGLQEKAKTYPAQLSGGQKQRVAIARALATNPKILLCDEPTSALDSLTTKSILQLLQDINQQFGVTILIITHEMAVVKAICNKVAVINNSTLVEQGATQNIFANPQSPVTKRLLGLAGGDCYEF